MLDLVSKVAVIRDLIAYQHECFSTIGHEETFNAIDHIIQGVMDMDTFGAVPVKHGHWIPEKNIADRFWTCSCCGFPSEAHGAFKLYHYCPQCGALMDEVKE